MQYCWPATANVVRCYMLRQFVACCCMLRRVVGSCCAKFETGQTFKPTTLSISFVPDCRSVLQQCWIRLRSSFNNVGVTHAHYPWSPWRSINVSQYCLLKTLMYQYCGIMHCKFQHYWELLHSFAHYC